MGAHYPSLRGDPHDGPDLNGAPSVNEMIDQLQAASGHGANMYISQWQRCVASAGGRVGLMWSGIFPTLIIGQAEDAQAVERREIVDRLWEHLESNGHSAQLIASLIGDRRGTRPGSSEAEIAAATNEAVLDFLAVDGSILIDGSDALAEEIIPCGHNNVTEGRTIELARATKAFITATCCSAAIPTIRKWATTLGQPENDGRIVLKLEHVEWWRVHGSYNAAYNAEMAYDRDFWTPEWQAAGAGDPCPPPMDPAVEHEMQRLQDRRCEIEDLLFAIPSPDAAAFAIKVGIARRDGRDLSGFDDLLVAEADRIAEQAASRRAEKALA